LTENSQKKYPEVNWNDLRRTRNDIAHIYDNMDQELIWETITEKIPEKKEACKRILNELGTS